MEPDVAVPAAAASVTSAGEIHDDAGIAHALGRAIAEARTRQKLSMRALAQAAGISQPFLSQIEKGRTMPSLLTLYRLAGGLGLSAADLLPVSQEASPVRLIPAGGGEKVRVSEAANAGWGRVLTGASAPVAISEYTINPGDDMGDWYQSDGMLVVYVLQGEVTVRIQGQGDWDLGPLDALEYPGAFRNVWVLRGDTPARILLVHAPDR